MINPFDWVKLKTFRYALDNMSAKIIADFIYNFGKKTFKGGCKSYAEAVRTKMALVCFELGKLIKEK